MKITHNPHGSWQRPSAVVDAAYQAEVDRCTQKAERQYRQAQKRLEQAEARLCRAQAQARTKKRVMAELVALVELRRAELEEYRRLMVSVAASAQHRGTKSFRPVPEHHGGVL